MSPKLAKSYNIHRIVSNPSNLTKSCQILAILHSFTKSNQSYIESYQCYIEYDESYTKSDQSRKSLLNLTISIKSYQILPNPSNLTRSCQSLAILHSFTKSNQSYIES